jgi:hypothetical protein
MSSIVIAGDTSGTCTLSANAVAGTTTLTLPTTSGVLYATPTGGVIPAASGGTGLSSVGTAGNVLTSNGSAWVSQAAAAFDAGTVMLFAQTTAPTGWTKDASNYNNYALRVVTGAASTGGSVGFTTAFTSQAVSGSVGTSGATTLSTAQMPAHNHVFATNDYPGGGGYFISTSGDSTGAATTSNTGGGGSHTHSGGSFTGTAINLAVQYVDVIRATKN